MAREFDETKLEKIPAIGVLGKMHMLMEVGKKSYSFIGPKGQTVEMDKGSRIAFDEIQTLFAKDKDKFKKQKEKLGSYTEYKLVPVSKYFKLTFAIDVGLDGEDEIIPILIEKDGVEDYRFKDATYFLKAPVLAEIKEHAVANAKIRSEHEKKLLALKREFEEEKKEIYNALHLAERKLTRMNSVFVKQAKRLNGEIR